MLDRAVPAGCVHRLEDEQQRAAVLHVQLVLLGVTDPALAADRERELWAELRIRG